MTSSWLVKILHHGDLLAWRLTEQWTEARIKASSDVASFMPSTLSSLIFHPDEYQTQSKFRTDMTCDEMAFKHRVNYLRPVCAEQYLVIIAAEDLDR